ncbi:hypothetical protein ACROYT_G044172 [Oculina patagonica]
MKYFAFTISSEPSIKIDDRNVIHYCLYTRRRNPDPSGLDRSNISPPSFSRGNCRDRRQRSVHFEHSCFVPQRV